MVYLNGSLMTWCDSDIFLWCNKPSNQIQFNMFFNALSVWSGQPAGTGSLNWQDGRQLYSAAFLWPTTFLKLNNTTAQLDIHNLIWTWDAFVIREEYRRDTIISVKDLNSPKIYIFKAY